MFQDYVKNCFCFCFHIKVQCAVYRQLIHCAAWYECCRIFFLPLWRILSCGITLYFCIFFGKANQAKFECSFIMKIHFFSWGSTLNLEKPIGRWIQVLGVFEIKAFLNLAKSDTFMANRVGRQRWNSSIDNHSLCISEDLILKRQFYAVFSLETSVSSH